MNLLTWCLIGATILDPAAKAAVVGDLVIRGDVIEKVGPGAGAQCAGERVDATGRFVIPGLVNMHSHAFRNDSPTGKAIEDLGRVHFARLVLQAGVMALLDLGDRSATLFPTRDKLKDSADHAWFGAAGFVFVSPKRAITAESATREVQAFAARNPAVLKILYKGGNIEPVVAAAKAAGLKTVVHIEKWETAERAIRAGATALTHLEDEAIIPDALVALWKQHNTVSIPTLAVQCDLARIAKDPTLLDDPLLKRVTTAAHRAEYRAVDRYNRKGRHWVWWQSELCVKNDMVSLRKLQRAGVRILAGPDTDNLGTFQGWSMHRELELLVEGGLSAWQTLASGTTDAADFLGLKWGVAAGDPANFIVLDASPLKRMANTRRIRDVIYKGRRLGFKPISPR
jgi:imidazolonepropionase-like amidohydrolase